MSMNDVATWRLLLSKTKELRTIARRLDCGAQFDAILTQAVIEANQRRRTAEEANPIVVAGLDVHIEIQQPATGGLLHNVCPCGMAAYNCHHPNCRFGREERAIA